MDAFETLIALLLKRDGYWTTTSFRVALTKDDKQAIGRHSSPRWELDVLAYKGAKNEVLVVECKSYLDSRGVVFRNGSFEPPTRYKLFTDDKLRDVVLARLQEQLVASGACRRSPRVTLCLAAGNVARVTDREGLRMHFGAQRWQLFDEDWICERLMSTASAGYENDVAHVAAKLILRNTRPHTRSR